MSDTSPHHHALSDLGSSILGRIDTTTYRQARRVVASRSVNAPECGNLLAMLGILDRAGTAAPTTAELRY